MDDIEHRRADGERVGWIRADGDHWSAIDLLGRVVAERVDWMRAEEALEERGLAYLADRWTLTVPGGEAIPVRITQLTSDAVIVAEDEGGAASVVGARPREHRLTFPLMGQLSEGSP